MTTEADAITPTKAPAGSDAPRPVYDKLTPGAQALADTLGRPGLAAKVYDALGAEVTAQLNRRILEVVGRASLRDDHQITAAELDSALAQSLARLAANAQAKIAEVRGAGPAIDKPDAAALQRERYDGVSRLD